METPTLIGTSGATILLIAFFLNQINKWKNEDIAYDASNLIGGSLMVYYAFLLESWPFLALNLVWTLVSLKDVVRYIFSKK